MEKVNKNVVREIVIETLKGALRGLEYQKKNLSSEPNQEKTVQMSINRLRNQIKFYEKDDNFLPKELSKFYEDVDDSQEPSEDGEFEIEYRA